jgi:hypothetical protein
MSIAETEMKKNMKLKTVFGVTLFFFLSQKSVKKT